MANNATWALIRNDLRLYFTDRRAVVVGVLVPILIASFFGYLFGGMGGKQEAGKIPVAIVDEDQSSVSQAIAKALSADALLAATTMDRASAEAKVRAGELDAAVVLPKDFGTQAVSALFGGNVKPEIPLLVDPSKGPSAQLVQGLLAQQAMQEIPREAFSGTLGKQFLDESLATLGTTAQPGESANRSSLRALLQAAKTVQDTNAAASSAGTGNGGFTLTMPYTVATQSMTSKADVPYNSYAHSYAGMAVQFILFAGIDAGIVLLLLRGRGIWQRFRAAPISKAKFIFARAAATALISLFQLLVIYAAAMLFFKVRIEGSYLGFAAIALAFCAMNAAFGLMLATIGKSAAATRGLATMAVLLLVMLGGAWVPSFVFPAWLQQISTVLPTRWAVDGFDAMTWRGLPLSAAAIPTAVLLGTALVCLAVAIWRFRWED